MAVCNSGGNLERCYTGSAKDHSADYNRRLQDSRTLWSRRDSPQITEQRAPDATSHVHTLLDGMEGPVASYPTAWGF